ncbi:BCCT family transporter [Georgenia thermotolerans]|uniref:BCCT family transporter n=2 Tax=Georgenia thermotolerans TaxID=527326 RepID=A0A7J5UPK1_9MICO|nr:BCCT family transporter [Georgenia thermotolerans]
MPPSTAHTPPPTPALKPTRPAQGPPSARATAADKTAPRPARSEAPPQTTAETATEPVTTNMRVFVPSAVGILAIALWAIVAPDHAATVIGSMVSWVSKNLGWYYILTATIAVVFVVFVAASRVGRTKLGPDHSKPQYSLFSWTAMLFAAGIGIDLMFFSVAEPVTQYYGPPAGQGETLEAARQAVVWTLFHYGITGWAMYALMGMAFGYFAYRFNMPLSIRSALYPIIGKRVHGVAGDAVDTAAMLGTIFGIATSLGIGVVQLNFGLKILFGVEEGLAAQIALITLAVIMATISAVVGIDKGIRRLSELNVFLAIGLMLYITVTGKTAFLLDALVLNIGDYLGGFADMTLNTFAFDRPDEWMNGWTLFFWAWWIAWAPFVGLFLARISRGRTIRQFVVATLTVPFLFILVWLSVFGNSALDVVLAGNDAFGQVAMNQPERAFYSLLEQYPGAPLLIGVATFTGLLFYVTSADSGSLVMSTFTSRIKDPGKDGPNWLRIFWSVATGVLTLGMLMVGGVATLQSATIIMGLPFSVVMYLIMAGLYKSLRIEAALAESLHTSLPGALSGRAVAGPQRSWRQRLARSMSYPGPAQAQRYMNLVALPAVQEVAAELRTQGAVVELTNGTVEGAGCSQVTLTVVLADDPDFRYQIYPVEHVTPTYAPRAQGRNQTYYRLEVFSMTGSHGYDLMGYTKDQVITDVLDQYERHLEFLHLQRDFTGSAMADQADAPEDWNADFAMEESKN